EQGENRGAFAAVLPEKYSNIPVGTVVTITYVDADDGTGASVTKSSSSTAHVADQPVEEPTKPSGKNQKDGNGKNPKNNKKNNSSKP
ncbi:MAG TPA: hypothetical protein VL020_06230, partial [Pseudomonadales bacterium]|nr:hypothetical protein [Pseudomonadales bacterium]